MTYETLINSTFIKPANKPNYTPTKTLKKALKLVRKFFKKSQKHQKFLNETCVFDNSIIMLHDIEIVADNAASDEECENLANERREAAALCQN